jgi:hypothetical protein
LHPLTQSIRLPGDISGRWRCLLRGTKIWEIGGFVAGAVLVLFGAAALYLGINGYRTVGDELDKEYIVGGSDMAPNEIRAAAQEANLPASIDLPSCNVVDKSIDSGGEARCFAQYMRIHALEGTGGLTYAQMGRYQSAANPDDARGTNDEAAAAKDESGNPVSNGARNVWVTETALATALNVSYMAEQISLFGIVVGIALLLTGAGFIILAFAVFHRRSREAAVQ